MIMEMITLILAMSAVMWYIIDRAKPLWAEYEHGKYITIGLSAIFAFGLTFAFEMDIVFAAGLFANATLAGKVLTGLLLMSGSSAVSEVLGYIKGEPFEVIDRDSNSDEEEV